MDDITREILALHATMDAQKRYYLPMWQEIADRVQPDNSQFIRFYQQGGKRTQYMFDETAAIANLRYAAEMESMLTPRTQRWHGLQARDEDLNEDPEIQQYFDEVTDILFKVRYAPGANFSSACNDAYQSNGAYGNGIVYIDDNLGKGFRYRSIHLSEIFFAENFAGQIDMVHRKFKMTLRQAYQRFGENLPPKFLKLYHEKRGWMEDFEFIHAVHPNPDYEYMAQGLKGMKYLSHYVAPDESHTIESPQNESKRVRTGYGYREMPYAISRYMTVPGDVYARGPCSILLPAIKQTNEIEKVLVRQAQLAVDKILLMPDDGNLTGFAMQPGAFVWGGLNADGEPMVKPLDTQANFQVGQESQDAKRKVIEDGLLVNLFKTLVEHPEMTATQVMMLAMEKGQLLAPTIGRSQSEFCGTIIPREIEILESAGELPEPPKKLKDAGMQWEVQYQSPLNLAQMASEGIAIMQTTQAIGEMAQFDPTLRALPKWEDAARKISKVNGMPTILLHTPDEFAALKQGMQQADNLKGMLDAAPQAASAAKDLATAQATAAAAPAQTAPIVMPRGAA